MEPSVEAIAKFRQIARKMLFPDRMVRSMDRILHVSQDRVHPPEVRVLTAFGSASRDVGLMNASGSGHSPEGSQSVRDNHRRRGQVLSGPAVDHRFAKPGHTGQPKALGTAVRGTGDGRHERCLSGGAPSPLSAPSLSAPVGVIDLDEAVQRAAVVSLLHHVKNLVLQKPGGVIGHPQLALEFQRRHRVLALGQEVDRQKPSRQRQLGRREDCPAGQRGLMVTGMALIPPDRQEAEPVVIAGRTAKPLRPPMAKHGLSTLRLGPELFLKVRETQPLLKLHPILGHDPSVMEVPFDPGNYSITGKANFHG